MRVLTASQMQAVDRRAIDELGIPGMVLMENAAVGVADAIGERFPRAVSVAIFCGPGNNGGDGLALTRILDARGYEVFTFLMLGSGPLKGDAARQLEILKRSGREVVEVASEDDVEKAVGRAEGTGLIVDALFGTGLSRPLSGLFESVVRRLSRSTIPKVAVDIPSGLDGSRGELLGSHLNADLTVTFAAPKPAHVLPPACESIGDLAVVDLGIPPELVEEAEGDLNLITEGAIRSMLDVPDPSSHKGSFGHVLLVGGSTGRCGAVILAAKAAVRGGAGLVTAAVPEPWISVVDGASLESMTLGFPDHAVSESAADRPSESAADAICRAAEGKAVVGLGPGLGLGEAQQAMVRGCLSNLELPVVLDADGLNAVAGDWQIIRSRKSPTILTPHPGEAARWLGGIAADVQQDRLKAARRLAEESGAIVVLKGFRTLVAIPGEDVWINPTGNVGMATGGSGDVLTGLLAALIARGYDPATAARIGVYAHGSAGDLMTRETGKSGLTALDLVAGIGRIWARWEEEDV